MSIINNSMEPERETVQTTAISGSSMVLWQNLIRTLAGEPVASNYGLLKTNHGLHWGYSGLFFPATWLSRWGPSEETPRFWEAPKFT